MANDVLPLRDMVDACEAILRETLRPLHYAGLTDMAAQRLGYASNEWNYKRQIEDVREHILQAGRKRMIYFPAPYCMGAIDWWFDDGQLCLIHPSSGIVIPGHAEHGADGAFEAVMRHQYMDPKGETRPEPLARRRARGLVLEKHVAGWFRDNWPQFYQPPDNDARWKQPCAHDFKLVVDGRTYLVDVSGPSANGMYGNPGNGKATTGLHLICEITGQDVLWRSVLSGKEYVSNINPDFHGKTPESMAVWLNCYKCGIDYRALAAQRMPMIAETEPAYAIGGN